MDKPKNKGISVYADLSQSNLVADDDEDPDKKIADKKWRPVEEWITHCAKNIFIVVAVIFAIVLVGTYLINLVAGTNYRWLTAEDMSAIKDLATAIITGVTVSFGVSLFFGKRH